MVSNVIMDTVIIDGIVKSQNLQHYSSNFHYCFDLAGPRGLFLKDARQLLPQLVERPRGFE